MRAVHSRTLSCHLESNSDGDTRTWTATWEPRDQSTLPPVQMAYAPSYSVFLGAFPYLVRSFSVRHIAYRPITSCVAQERNIEALG